MLINVVKENRVSLVFGLMPHMGLRTLIPVMLLSVQGTRRLSNFYFFSSLRPRVSNHNFNREWTYWSVTPSPRKAGIIGLWPCHGVSST